MTYAPKERRPEPEPSHQSQQSPSHYDPYADPYSPSHHDPYADPHFPRHSEPVVPSDKPISYGRPLVGRGSLLEEQRLLREAAEQSTKQSTEQSGESKTAEQSEPQTAPRHTEPKFKRWREHQEQEQTLPIVIESAETMLMSHLRADDPLRNMPLPPGTQKLRDLIDKLEAERQQKQAQQLAKTSETAPAPAAQAMRPQPLSPAPAAPTFPNEEILVASTELQPGLFSKGQVEGSQATKEKALFHPEQNQPQQIAQASIGTVIPSHIGIVGVSPQHYHKLSEDQFKQAIQKDMPKLKLEALREQFGLDEVGARMALEQFPGGIAPYGYSTFNGDRTVQFSVNRDWFTRFSQLYNQKRQEQAKEQTAQQAKQQQAEQKARQQQRQSAEKAYLNWSQAMNQTSTQRQELTELLGQIAKSAKAGGGTVDPQKSLELAVQEQVSALANLTGQPVSATVQQGIRNKVLFERYDQAKEIVVLGQTLEPSQRTGLNQFYTHKLTAEQQAKVSEQTDALYRAALHQEPKRGDSTWVVFRNRLLRQNYADASGVGQQVAQSTQPQSKVANSSGLDTTHHSGVQNPNQSIVQPETPVQRFQHDLQQAAIARLEANENRLNVEEDKYRDTSAKNPHWSHLRALAHQDETFRAEMVTTTDTLWKLIKTQTHTVAAFTAGLTVPAPKGDLAARREKVLSYFSSQVKDPAAQAQVVELLNKLDFIETQKSELRIQYPALGAIDIQQAIKMSGKPGENQALLAQISGKFDETRQSADQLVGQIQHDPSAALGLDRIVSETLGQEGVSEQKRKAGDPKSQTVLDWLEHQQRVHGAIEMGGMIATGGLTLASFFVPEFAVPMRIAAGVAGLGTAGYELPQLMQQDLAARSAQLGGKKLTSVELEEARFNLTMGYTNVVLGGLDVGLETGMIQRLSKLPGLVRSAASLTKEQSRVLMSSLARVHGNVTDAVIQKITQAVKKADAATTIIVENADGTLMQSRPLEQVANRVDGIAANSAAARKVPKPEQMTPAERFAYSLDKYGQTKNWDQVQSLIGQTFNKNTQLPPGYVFYEKPAKKGAGSLFILRQNADDGSFVPLMIEKGKIQAGKTRLSRGLDAMKANLRAVGSNVPTDWQVNHLIPDEIAQSNPLMIEALKRDLFDVDRASNLLPMPGEAAVRKANPNLMGHQGSHGDYSKLIRDELTRAGEGLIGKHGSLGNVPEAELKKTIETIENRARSRILNNDISIPTRIDPKTGTKVISDANLDDPESIA